MSLHAIGITAEYNPFHNGHRWQLQTLREKSGNVPVIACMSGWFVQRGEMAAVDPWIRASMAVHAGVDLVVLLPAWYSLRSADYFAAGAVKTLAATGIVDTLCAVPSTPVQPAVPFLPQPPGRCCRKQNSKSKHYCNRGYPTVQPGKPQLPGARKTPVGSREPTTC